LTLKNPKFVHWFNQSWLKQNEPVLKLFFSLLSINSAEAEATFNFLELLPGLWTYLLKSDIAIWSEEVLFKKALEYAKVHDQAKPYDSLSYIQYSILSSEFLIGVVEPKVDSGMIDKTVYTMALREKALRLSNKKRKSCHEVLMESMVPAFQRATIAEITQITIAKKVFAMSDGSDNIVRRYHASTDSILNKVIIISTTDCDCPFIVVKVKLSQIPVPSPDKNPVYSSCDCMLAVLHGDGLVERWESSENVWGFHQELPVIIGIPPDHSKDHVLFLATNMKKVWLNSGPQFNFNLKFPIRLNLVVSEVEIFDVIERA